MALSAWGKRSEETRSYSWVSASQRVSHIPRNTSGVLSRAASTSRALKEALASCLVIALGLILAVHFSLFWMYVRLFIYESNNVILAVETVVSVTILGFGIEQLLSC